jgi:hypothetical protein
VNSERSFTGNCGLFAEYRVCTRRISLKIPPSNEAYVSPTEIVMKNLNTLSTKLTAFAAALVMNGIVMSAVGYCFALQANAHMTAVAFARAVVTHQWLS